MFKATQKIKENNKNAYQPPIRPLSFPHLQSSVQQSLLTQRSSSNTYKPIATVGRIVPKFVPPEHMKKTFGNVLQQQNPPSGNCTKKKHQMQMGDDEISKELRNSSVINAKKKRVQIGMDDEHCNVDVNPGPSLDQQHVKKTRGITIGLRVAAIVSATKHRVTIKMNKDQNLPETVEANAMFVNEIGSFTRKMAPLKIKRWKKDVTENHKQNIIEALTTNFDFDENDPELRIFVEKKMAKAFRSWRNKLHGHFKKHGHDLEYARANPPCERLFGERTIDEWKWLCDEVFTNEDYMKQCQANVANRNKKQFNHCGGSRPYQKHMEAATKKGKNVTFVENWSTMHQHNNGEWINEIAEQKGQMLAELNKTKEDLANALGSNYIDDEIEVPISMQLEILNKGIGVTKGRGIKGLGYGPRKEVASYERCQSSAPMMERNLVKLTSTVKKLMRHIEHIEAQLANVDGYKIHDFTAEDADEDEDVDMEHIEAQLDNVEV